MKHLKTFKLFEAKMPDSHIQKNAIKNMKPGDIGYTVPWAVRVNQDGDCFINGDFTIVEKGGTCCLKIKIINSIGYSSRFSLIVLNKWPGLIFYTGTIAVG